MAIFTKLNAFIALRPVFIKLLLILLFTGCYNWCAAQKALINLTGVVYNKDGSQRVSNVLIADLASNTIVTSSELGSFQIACSVGDTLLFRQKNYTDQKIKVLADFVLVVYLQQNINLNEVDIHDVTKRQELYGIMNDYNKKGVYNGGKTGVLAAIFHPVNALYDLFGSGPKQARLFQRDADAELGLIEVNKKFTVALVQQVTGLKDVKLKNFMDSYRPAYADCKKWNEYDMIAYIKKSYVEFEKNGEPALPKLY